MSSSERASSVFLPHGELSRRGRDVVCLEQLTPGHDRAGSKSRARILRAGYHDPFHVRLAMRTWRGWKELEEESGRQLFVQSGLLSYGRRVDELLESMRQGGTPGEIVSKEEAGERFPGLSVSGRAVYEAAAGVLLADEVLRALVHGHPFEVLEGHAVTGISDGGDRVTIEAVASGEQNGEVADTGQATAGGRADRGEGAGPSEDAADGRRTFECRAAILCGGAWSSALARMAGLSMLADALWASLQQVVYVSLPERDAERLPAVVWYGDSGVSYGLPTPGQAVYKLGLHDPRERADPAHVSLVDSSSGSRPPGRGSGVPAARGKLRADRHRAVLLRQHARSGLRARQGGASRHRGRHLGPRVQVRSAHGRVARRPGRRQGAVGAARPLLGRTAVTSGGLTAVSKRRDSVASWDARRR